MRVALVGCGPTTKAHATVVRGLGDDISPAFCDPDVDIARRTAAAFGGGPAYDTLDHCLAAERPDVVHVCTPPETHADVAVRALAAGAAVLVENPLALSRTETTLIAGALRRRPGALCVDHSILFAPCMLTARGWVSAGRIGAVLAADVFVGIARLPRDPGRGASGRALPGGRFTDVLPHAISIARDFVGDVERVAACDGQGPAGRSDLGVTLACARGLGSIRVSLAATQRELGVVVRGEEGTIRVDLARQRAVLVQVPRGSRRRVTQLLVAAAIAAQTALGVADRMIGKATGRLCDSAGMRTLIAAFHRSVRDGLPPPVPFRDGAAVVAAVDTILACLRAGEAIADARRVPA
jgi:predicted dehydrogenase